MRSLFGACAALLLHGFMATVVAAEDCASLEACLEKYPIVAKDGSGVGPEESDLAEVVQRYGTRAIPPLLAMLESDQANVRMLAGYTLRDIEGLTAEHLAPLIQARKNGDGWIPPAIARVGTPEAIAFLVEDLRRDPETHTQVTWAFELLGAKGATALTELLKCTENCDDRVLSVAVFVFSELKEKAVPAVPALLQIAHDPGLADQSRQFAILAIGETGEASQSFVPQLLSLRKQAALEPAVDSALASMGAAEAVPGLLQLLPQDADYQLPRIAGLGKNGYLAGPEVMKYLESGDWDIRVAAADTLGRIGYLPAQAVLEKALRDEDDWKLVYGAVLALSRLEATSSIQALEQVRDRHWYPPVRNLAAGAIAHLRTGTVIEEPDFWQHTAIEGSPNSCLGVKEKAIVEPKSRKLRSDRHPRELQRLAYDSSIRSYGPPDDAKPDEDGVISVTRDNMVEHVQKVRQVPRVALKVGDGWLVGSDRGEWGGELVHLAARGATNVLSEDNVEGIYLLGETLVATTGLAHGMNNGFLLKIAKNDSGRYFAAPWKRLPAAPGNSWLIEGGELLVNTYSGGSVLIDSKGNFRMAECTTEWREDSVPPQR